HSVGSRAGAFVDEMTAPDVTTSPDRNDRADRHERVVISEEIQYARVWAAVLQQHVVPSPLRARCHNKTSRQFVPVAHLTNHVSMLRLYDAHCRRGFRWLPALLALAALKLHEQPPQQWACRRTLGAVE